MKRIIKTELKHELKKAAEQMREMEGETIGWVKDDREGKHADRKGEEMRAICEGEARDEEKRNPDEGDSPHHHLKDR